VTERWSSVDELAEHLGVAQDTIYRWIERRRLPAHRIGRLWKFKLDEVDDWVRAGSAALPEPGDRISAADQFTPAT
jgi:excisionase family DNA binding protein